MNMAKITHLEVLDLEVGAKSTPVFGVKLPLVSE